MNSGVQCKIDPQCPVPAPSETRICHVHHKQMRLEAMRKSPELSTRIIGRALTLLADREAG